MRKDLRNPIGRMLQALASWLSYKQEKSNILVNESDVVSEAISILQVWLPKEYRIQKEVTQKDLSIVPGKKKIDLGIYSKDEGRFHCLIEFKLADATNEGYKGDVRKLYSIKREAPNIDCLVVIVCRKSYSQEKPKQLVLENGKARRSTIHVGKSNLPVKVRRVCHSCTAFDSKNSKKTICLEVL